jgi:hypothetical protein
MAQSSHQEDRTISVTTAEVNERRHLVKPYDERPVLELADGVVACLNCGNPQFRRSRLRFTDIGEILMMRYPVRCTRCGQRQYRDFIVAMLAFPPRPAHRRVAEIEETWRKWTDPSMPSQPVARPLSTALGPQARNLEATSLPPRHGIPVHTLFDRAESNTRQISQSL